MDIADFETLMDKCTIVLNEKNCVFFEAPSFRIGKKVAEIVRKNHLENLSLPDFQKMVKENHPQYVARNKIKQIKAKEFSLMSPEKVAELPLEKKLEYMDTLFYPRQKADEIKSVCAENYENIKACLFNISFPQKFWEQEKQAAERYAALIASQPQIVDKMKNWDKITLEEKKNTVTEAGKVFGYVYGIKPEIVFFAAEEERAQNIANGLSENAHINAAYCQGGKIHFNEERLEESDNFFAVSTLLHEGTHLRQSLQTFEDAAVERIFACNLVNATVYEKIINDKNAAEYKDLYAMQPDEVHAHGLQEFAEQLIIAQTGVEKLHYSEQSKDVQRVHNKAFSMTKISQYKSAQKN